MATPAASVTNTFVVGTAAVAADVNQNFTDLVVWLNNNATIVDATKPFTGIPTVPSEPSSSNELACKSYVDKKGSTCLSTARPASPVTGQLIFETDKSRVRMWNGSLWQLISGSQGVSLTNTGTVIAANATTTLTYATENYDTDNFFTPATSTSNIVIPEAGTYSVTMRLTQTTGNTFVAGYGSYANIIAPGSNNYYLPASTHLNNYIGETYVIPFSAGDTFSTQFANGSNGSITFNVNIVVRRIGD